MTSTDLAEKLISDHNNPIIKKAKQLESKLFLEELKDKEPLEKCLEDLERTLRHQRVDRRIARATAEWLPEKSIAKVTKKTGAVANYGEQNKNGKFLNAQETLYLLETNKLELTCKEMPVSIEEAFRNIQNVDKYLAYKQLVLHGYRLKSKKFQHKNDEPGGSQSQPESPPAKIAKMGPETEIFEKLRQIGPKCFEPNGRYDIQPDFNVQVPSTTGKGESFNLVVSTSQEFATSVDAKNLTTHAVVADANVAFYKFYSTEIPIL